MWEVHTGYNHVDGCVEKDVIAEMIEQYET